MDSLAEHQPLQDGDLLAAVDLGSNSFHLVVARYTLGQLRIVDRIKEMVRLASGLNPQSELDPAAMETALECLARFGQRLRTLPPHLVRAIGTNTIRQLGDPLSFLLPAEEALGHGIDIVSGREEARLVYLGVANGHPPGREKRLVIDIGGGSSEYIIGSGFAPLERESLQMGCIATTRRFFSDHRLSFDRWHKAKTEMAAEFQQFASMFHEIGWQEAYGSSGTIKEIGEIAQAMGSPKGVITEDALGEIVERLLKARHIDDIDLPYLSARRKNSIAGGLLVLSTAFSELKIKSMMVSRYAMREGILYDLVGRRTDQDPRDASVEALMQRYAIDRAQAGRVERTALHLFEQVHTQWQLTQEDRSALIWAARLHEIGLAIAHSQYHLHGAYVVENSDIAGFSRTEQLVLSALIRNQRRNLHQGSLLSLPDRLAMSSKRIAILLRVAVLLHRSHDGEKLPPINLSISERSIRLSMPPGWLDEHPLTQADLSTEREHLSEMNFHFDFS